MAFGFYSVTYQAQGLLELIIYFLVDLVDFVSRLLFLLV